MKWNLNGYEYTTSTISILGRITSGANNIFMKLQHIELIDIVLFIIILFQVSLLVKPGGWDWLSELKIY